MKKKILSAFLLPVACLLASCSTSPEVDSAPMHELHMPALGAPLNMPARQVGVRGNNITVLGQTVGGYAPTNTLQAYIEWMDDNWGDAGIDTNASYTFANSTTQSYWDVIVRNDLAVSGDITADNVTATDTVTASNDLVSVDDTIVGDDLIVGGDATITNDATVGGNLTVSGTVSFNGDVTWASNDMAVSYGGYPKVTLTTNMLTFYESGTSTEIPLDSFTNAFDADVTTVTSQGDMAASDIHTYVLDLGENYNGWAFIKMSCTSTTDSATMYIQNSAMVDLQASAYQMPRMNQLKRGLDSLGASVITFWDVQPINGRYVYWTTETGGDDDLQYWIHDWSIYGTTNAYRNMGGF